MLIKTILPYSEIKLDGIMMENKINPIKLDQKIKKIIKTKNKSSLEKFKKHFEKIKSLNHETLSKC